MKRHMVQLIATWRGVNAPCFVDPETVSGIFPLDMPGTSRVEYGEHGVICVLGTPDDVYAALFGDCTAGGGE